MKNNYSIPEPKTFIISNGDKCRLSGVANDSKRGWIATIYNYNTNKFFERTYYLVEKYLTEKALRSWGLVSRNIKLNTN